MSGQAGAYLTLLLIVVLAYLVLIRPARRRAQAAQRLQSALTPGDEVMLTSGLFATVVEVQDEVLRVEVSAGVIVRVHRRAVGQIVTGRLPSFGDAHDVSSPVGEPAEPSGDENPGVN